MVWLWSQQHLPRAPWIRAWFWNSGTTTINYATGDQIFKASFDLNWVNDGYVGECEGSVYWDFTDGIRYPYQDSVYCPLHT